MNPEERETLSRLLPSPGEPVLTDDRHDRLQDHLLRELTTPAPVRRPRRRFTLITVPVATAAIIAGALVATRTERPEPDPQAVAFLNRAAAVAATRKTVPVRDDQYVYVRTQGFMKFSDDDIRTLREASWTAVDGEHTGLRRITVLNGPPSHARDPFASYSKGTHDLRLNPDPNIPALRDLEELPTDPDKLLREIRAENSSDPAQTLETIGDMLPDAALLPALNAALYRAAAKIPGVSLVPRAEDYAGRTGVGLTFKSRGDRTTWVFDAKSLDYLGSATEALLDVGVTDKPGEAPATEGGGSVTEPDRQR
ncbi:CU044_5270 family protein [Streptomyces sp. SID13726]|uniref:CU044_5270 family protein n=1 Tax=Streptomyces sp. SID13726 TaxID=2706058 RepID=UPI0013B75B4B|nr:CU044_5270 family protein [Streptomyces sp. SID13726]NEB00408.1 hypothetical protein [Streptomyces sp. SID13726]